jgi:hypothetical protein
LVYVVKQATPAAEGAVEKIQELASNAASVVSSALGLSSDEKASTDNAASSTAAETSDSAAAPAAADASSDASTNSAAAAVLAEGTTDAEPAAGKQVVDVIVSAPVTAGEVAPQG